MLAMLQFYLDSGLKHQQLYCCQMRETRFDIDENHAHACMHHVGGTKEERVSEREGGTKRERKIGTPQKV
jgi:hypothetical protein